MDQRRELELDVVVFGASASGLWVLERLRRAGLRCVALEAKAMGSGQTIGCQGIIHGGLKYTLSGMLTASAKAIRDMPARWRESIDGGGEPALTDRVLSAPHCHLWRSASIGGKLGMIGARVGLRVKPIPVNGDGTPDGLKHVRGEVFRLDEQVISPSRLIEQLAAVNDDHVLQVDGDRVALDTSAPGRVSAVALYSPLSLRRSVAWPLLLKPRAVVFAAGAGNAALRESVGLDAGMMQVRPVQMLLVRGDLPVINGHCVDGAKTRVTITSHMDGAGRAVWQVGGQVSEDGVNMQMGELVEHGRREVEHSLGGLDLSGTEWSTYWSDKAEATTAGGRRPDDAYARREGNVITAWPTKLALVPRLAELVYGLLHHDVSCGGAKVDMSGELADWPRPQVALSPWEEQREWITAR